MGRDADTRHGGGDRTAAGDGGTLPLPPGTWTLDHHHSSVGFEIRHLGISKVRGRFGEVDATLVVGRTLDDCSVTATVALGSVDTGNADRDAHVRAPDMLDVERRPEMTFRSSRLRGAGAEWAMDGTLTIGEVSREVSFTAEFGGLVDSVLDDRRHCGFEARGEIRRSDFGLGFGAGDALLGDVVKVQLDVQFVEPEAPGA
ncbi:YceI family protein [Streptomyces sp. JJ36]|uniref:YceI family protein n=1 Tax=Streptomyces sp. JJ36 TaxID=2736645 RepID=UPI001F194231|nr:YceI family protein [Streptomyces sp. JJ36]MCF6526558.1 YceI family protein [Streptomyces sp. JJ36]